MLNRHLKTSLHPAALTVHAPVHAGLLSVFPITGPAIAEPFYIPLDEALASGVAAITEVSDNGSVPELLFRNEGDSPVLLLDGEELVGAKQNRVLNLTVLAPAHREITIPVSCIEAGRWAWRSRRFSSADRTLFAEARFMKMEQVSASMRRGSRRSDQGEIWNSISRKSASFRVDSDTSAASDIYEQRRADLDRMVESLGALPGQMGAAFAVGGKLVGLELFGATGPMKRLLPKLVRSYGLDAIDPERAAEPAGDAYPTLADVREMLDRIFSAPLDAHPAVGLGADLRMGSRGVVAAALVNEGELVHLSGFAG